MSDLPEYHLATRLVGGRVVSETSELFQGFVELILQLLVAFLDLDLV